VLVETYGTVGDRGGQKFLIKILNSDSETEQEFNNNDISYL